MSDMCCQIAQDSGLSLKKFLNAPGRSFARHDLADAG